MTKKKLAKLLLEEVERIYPEAITELANWNDDFQFLICIVLSAQTTDKQVNKVTKELFTKYPDSKKLALADVINVENILKGINYYKTKSKHIIELAKMLNEKFFCKVPLTINELIKLPGVGYKTANVFLNDRYKSNQGIAVDTHVMRVARSYGLTNKTEPTKIAHDLENLYPRKDWWKINSTFVLYGRYILKAKKPNMDRVVLKDYLVL